MATFNYCISVKKREMAPIYVRFLAGRKADYEVKTGLFVDPDRWSNETQTIRQRIRTEKGPQVRYIWKPWRIRNVSYY